jgi:replicative DNA helicase
MQAKLTLRIDDALISAAKRYAESNDKSVSQVVSDYFQVLQQSTSIKQTMADLPPITRSLKGLLKKSKFTTFLDKKHKI